MFSLKMVQEHVSMLFYRHGLLCASHPFAIISLVCTIVMFMWLVSTCCNIFVYQQHFFVLICSLYSLSVLVYFVP